ncbi:hypothetical protein [Sphingobium sp. Z007]|uniref:hypothetical protein n=1 Tax=Sphingobium sp. Z007 TaxID=627495 RepID=UPI000B4A2888|nr:hypothetical protein [Sphingobium sp. Z007]
MEIEPRPVGPEQMEEAILLCRKRIDRAVAKVASAMTEKTAALLALEAAEHRLAAWQAANPDPQRSIFEELSNV